MCRDAIWAAALHMPCLSEYPIGKVRKILAVHGQRTWASFGVGQSVSQSASQPVSQPANRLVSYSGLHSDHNSRLNAIVLLHIV